MWYRQAMNSIPYLRSFTGHVSRQKVVFFIMTQISARLDCVENLTRQRHDRDQTENQQNALLQILRILAAFRCAVLCLLSVFLYANNVVLLPAKILQAWFA